MSYIIWFLFIALGVVKSESKIVNALQKTWIVVMWGMANNISDIDSYRMHFLVSMPDFSPKYIFLEEGIYRNFCWLFRTLGFSFDIYLILLAVFCVLVIDGTMDYFEIKLKGLVWSALMIFPMNLLNPVLQGRLAFCVILLGLRFLKEFKFKNVLLFGLTVIISGCIHTGAYEYAILFAVYTFQSRKQAFLEVSGLVFLEMIFINIVKNIILWFNVDEFRLIDAYFQEPAGYGRAVGHILVYIGVMLVASYGYKINEKDEKVNLMNKIMWAMMLGYPLIYLSTQLRRNLEVMFFVPYMCIAHNIIKLSSIENKRAIKLITIATAALVYYGFHVRNFEQFRLNYVRIVINGNYISQGVDIVRWIMIAAIIFMCMYLFTEYRSERIQKKRIRITFKVRG